jgi:membrane-associated phospholipid phosphatase
VKSEHYVSDLEIAVIRGVQSIGTGPVPGLARAYSSWGEHARGWIALGLAASVVDAERRPTWLSVAGSAFCAHGAAVVLKHVARRRRPFHPAVRVLGRTPSDLSFPSAHAASTTASAVALAPIVGTPAAVGLTTGMVGARILLGVHYPSDVAVGETIGAVTGFIGRRVARRWQG